MQGVFIQEKWLNLIENSKLCGILTCPIPNHLSPAWRLVLKTDRCNHNENQHPGKHWRGRNGLELFPNLIPRKCHNLTCQVISWKSPLARLFLFDLTQISQCKQPFLQGHLLKAIRCNRWNAWLPEEVDNSWNTQSLPIKALKKKNWRMKWLWSSNRFMGI